MAISANKRHNVFMKTFYHCAYCGKILDKHEDLTIDHKNPKAKGGTDEMDNLVGCCKSCNQLKADRTVAEFKKRLVEAANISNAFSGEKYDTNIEFFFEKYSKDYLTAINNLK
jgi:5-methylcytosine-specific restriction endonuclease McrA